MGFSQPDEFSQFGKRDIAADLTVGVEQRLRRQAAELKTAAQASCGLAFGVGVATGHTPHALGGDVLGDVFIHFNEDEVVLAAVLGVLLEHGGAVVPEPAKLSRTMESLSVAICRMR